MRTVLFVCTGNTCRSPLAEGIAQRWVDQGGLGEGQLLAVSAGAVAISGVPTSPETVDALHRMGIEFTGRSKPLTAEMIEAAEVVFAMTPAHAAAARALVSEEAAKKIHLLDPEGPIDDPIGMGQAAYDALAQHLQKLIPQRLQELLTREDRAGVGSSGREGG